MEDYFFLEVKQINLTEANETIFLYSPDGVCQFETRE